ncbi:MAG: oligosaccharide flippase family protein [Bacteroidales bacterium]
MSSFNLKSNIFSTILSKGFILILNFAIVVFTTQLWGAEGKGIIALFVADLGLIGIFANVFTGSSVSYYFSKIGKSKLATQGYCWVFFVSAVAAIVTSLTGENNLTVFLFIVSVFLGILAFQNSLFIGSQKIRNYNIITVLQPLLLLIFMFFFHFGFHDLGYYSYFYGQITSLFIILIICGIMQNKDSGNIVWDLNKEAIKQSFSYGWKTELSNFLQFFNYRLSFYLLHYFIGINSVGIFSIGVALSEAIWVISRSMSLVQFSNVIKQGDTESSKKETISISKYSFWGSLLCLLVLLALPSSLFGFIFGSEFSSVKEVVLFLSPGILAISVSNVFGNYFSAIKKLNILIIKSAIGLLVTLVLSLWLIPILEIQGACISNSVSYLISSMVLILYFFRKR